MYDTMRSTNKIIFALMLACVLAVAGCISSGDDTPAPTTTAAPYDGFQLGVTVDGQTTYITYDEIIEMPAETFSATMVKKTGAEIETTWTGTSFYGVMEYMGFENIVDATFVALDGYEKFIEYDQLQEAKLVWQDETGTDLTEETGGPIRLVAPGLPANAWITNLIEIRVTIEAPYDGFQLAVTSGGQTEYVNYDDLIAINPVTFTATMVKKTGEEIETTWTGTSVYGFMDYMGFETVATLTFVASDGYQKGIDYTELTDAMIVWQDETGTDLTEETGGPIRLVAPGLSSSSWVTNLVEIQVTI
jgi:DMSO/TMAO reductase YedYZ molybdopterin-dependent catalytic subunit